MSDLVVSDTSCLIVLQKIGQLHLLRALFSSVVVTPKVAEEYGEPLPDWVEITTPRDSIRQHFLESQLDAGEASAINLALELSPCVLLIDEKKGRRVATDLGLPIIGTIRLLIDARAQNLIPSLKAALLDILETDFRVSERLVADILEKYGD